MPMSLAFQSAARAYASVGLETDVASHDPAQLVVMLYDGALLCVGRARTAMLARDTAQKGEFLSRALQIIDEGLKASLDLEHGNELARQLWQLYEYMCRRLLLASMKNDVRALDEVTRLLSDLKEAWAGIESSRPAANVLPLHRR